jgi:hypothetical protein
MKFRVLAIAALSGLWTLIVAFSTYMTPTGLIDRGDLIVAGVPFALSLILTLRFALRGGGWLSTSAAVLIALVPLTLFSFVALTQFLFPSGVPAQ